MRRMLLALTLVAGCEGETISAATHGRNLLADTDLSDGSANVFACSDCHEMTPGGAEGRIMPGYSLVDSAHRESFWGGYERTLLDAMSFCRVWFMGGVRFEEEDEDARAILEYVLSVSQTDPAPMLALTVTLDIVPIELGDPAEGEAVYDGACRHCHGSPGGSPPERFRGTTEPIPDDEAGWGALYDENFPDTPYSLIVIEKIRHGRFFLVGGTMPLFSHEAMTDEEVGALIAFLFPD